MKKKLILASTSPFRRQLLNDAGLEFTSQAPEVNERKIEEGAGADIAPSELALLLSRAKALAVAEHNPDAVVIGCDQTMAMGNDLFHKPADMISARQQLSMLRGATHILNSGIVLACNGSILWEHVGQARLTMRDFTDEFLERYLERVGSRATQSVGGYQLEGEGIQLFEKVEGDYFTIIGLPLLPLLAQLRILKLIQA